MKPLDKKASAVTQAHDFWFDNIKGILMITVVVGHMIAQIRAKSPDFDILYNLINTFHMGTFLVLTGYLSKRRIEQKDYLSIFNKNVIPYITAQLFLYFTAVILPEGLRAANSSYFNRSYFSFLLPVFQLWFLVAITLYAVFSALVQPKKHPLLFMAGAIAATILCGYSQQINVLKLTKVISFYPFFLLGYLFPGDWMTTLRNRWQYAIAAIPIWIGYIFFISHAEWTVGLNQVFGLSTGYADCKPLYMGIPAEMGRLLFVVGVSIIAFAFFALCPRRQCIFSKLGKNSMYIYVLHSLFAVASRCLHYAYGFINYFDTWYLKLLYLAISILIAFFLGSNLVKKLFKPILEPNIKIENLIGSLYDRYLENKDNK